MSTPRITCTLTIDVPVLSDLGTHRADLRAASASTTQVPPGARIRLRCGSATYFQDHELDLLARRLTPASAIEIESSHPAFAVALHSALCAAWQIGAAR